MFQKLLFGVEIAIVLKYLAICSIFDKVPFGARGDKFGLFIRFSSIINSLETTTTT